jgi:hypothetical protein
MGYMEIAVLPKAALRIKGKNASFIIDPEDGKDYNASILVGKASDPSKSSSDEVIIEGPGEYEIGGVKITGTRSNSAVIYSLKIDGIDVVLGKLSSLDAMHQKMKEHNIVVVLCNETGDASFLTSLTSNSVIFYGEKGLEIAQSIGKENLQKMSKYTTAKDKLPQEVETIVLE